MSRRLQVTIDCAHPEGLCRFWAEVLGYVVPPPPTGHASWRDWYRAVGVPEEELVDGGEDRLVDPGGVGPAIWFQSVPEPKAVKNRVHLDVDVSGGREVPLSERRARVQAEAERITTLGGRVIRVLDADYIDHFAIVMADPEGNEFCLG